MASTLMMSVSGIRGIVGDTLTPDLILKTGAAFAKFCSRGTIILGRDSRPTGDAIARGMASALSLCGCDVVDIGIVPTPTVQIMVEELKASGGIVISASHNPIQWNAFKLINKSGTFLNSSEIDTFFKLMDSDFKYMKWDKVGLITNDPEAENIHIDKVLEIVAVNKIKRKKFKVVLDSVNGAGSRITQRLLEKLGCSVIPVYCSFDGCFPRGAEPLPENLAGLSEAVKKNGAHIGFAQDPDADRLAIVDEKGQPIGEEYTLALVTEHLLSKKKGRVVTNLSTTKAIDVIALKHGVNVKRTKVGEINVVDEMRQKETRIGGEGNGGIISPEVHLGRDSLVGIAYILEMMLERDETLSEIVAALPQYVMKKGKVKIKGGNLNSNFLDDIVKEYHCEKITQTDGLRIDFITESDFKGGWVHLRPSNTEPIFRIIAEGRDKKHAEKIYSHFSGMFKQIIL